MDKYDFPEPQIWSLNIDPTNWYIIKIFFANII